MQGCEDEFRRFYDEHFRHIYNYVFYRVCDRAAAEDLTAEVFHKALRAFGRYSEVRSSERTWVYAIARNSVRDHFRRRALRSWVGLDWLERSAGGPQQPDEELLQEEALARLAQVLGGVEKREREIIALKFGLCLNNCEISRETGLSESNVGTILHRLLGRLKDALLPEEGR